MLTQKKFKLILFVGLIIMSTFAYFNAANDFFSSNLLPELMGVFIELLIVLLVVDVWQKNDIKEKKIINERRLREFLIFFLKQNFIEFYKNEDKDRIFFGGNSLKNEKMLLSIIEDINNKGLKEEKLLIIQKYCEEQKDIIHSLIPVASKLTNEHFKAWVRISYFMNATCLKTESTSHSTIRILEYIIRFDKSSDENNLYVGA